MNPNNLTMDALYQNKIMIRVPSEDLFRLSCAIWRIEAVPPLDALMARDNYSGQNESETMELRKERKDEDLSSRSDFRSAAIKTDCQEARRRAGQ